MNIKLISIVYLVLIIFSSCENNQPSDFDYGKVKNNIYSNSFFNCEIKLPVNWTVLTSEQTEAMANRGKQLISGDNQNMKAVIKASEINTANLLSVFKYEVGAPVDYNPNLSMVAENIKDFPAIKNGKDYLFHVRKILNQSQLKYDYLDDDFREERIGGLDFYLMNTRLNYLGKTINQIYFSTIIKKFTFNIIISFTDSKQKDELMQTVNSIKFSL
jgi:hypothetical protein